MLYKQMKHIMLYKSSLLYLFELFLI